MPSVPAQAAPLPPTRTEHGVTWMDEVAQLLAPEIHRLKGLAIGTLMGVLRDLVTEPLPETLRPQVNELVDSVTTKLGGERVQGAMLDQLLPRRHDDHHNGHHNAPQEQYRG